MLAKPPPADWLMWRGTFDSWGHSPLEQITARNVGQLRLVWSRALAPGDQEGTPLVHDGVMFFPNPNAITQALDASTATCYGSIGGACPRASASICLRTPTNRNLAIYDRPRGLRHHGVRCEDG